MSVKKGVPRDGGHDFNWAKNADFLTLCFLCLVTVTAERNVKQ